MLFKLLPEFNRQSEFLHLIEIILLLQVFIMIVTLYFTRLTVDVAGILDLDFDLLPDRIIFDARPCQHLAIRPLQRHQLVITHIGAAQ